MSENQAKEWVKELQADIQDKALPQTARLPGDSGRWTRRRAMPLEDMARRTLAKQGLSAVMEARRYFGKTGAIENCASGSG